MPRANKKTLHRRVESLASKNFPLRGTVTLTRHSNATILYVRNCADVSLSMLAQLIAKLGVRCYFTVTEQKNYRFFFRRSPTYTFWE